MSTAEEFAQTFPSERVLQQALAKLLSKIPGHTGVQILQGPNEVGKDIIFYTPAAFGRQDLNACVIKNTKITGSASGTTGARTVFNQAQQALDSPLLDENGHEQRVNRVFVVTPYPIPSETTASILGALRSAKDEVQFVSGTQLLELFKLYWPEYLAEELKVIQAYADALADTAGTAKELSGLSFQYQLGAVDTDIKRVYVQPRFHRIIRSFSLRPFYQNLPNDFHEQPYNQGMIDQVKMQISNTNTLFGHLAQWELCEEKFQNKVRSASADLSAAVIKGWSTALSGRAARASGANIQGDSFGSKLANTSELNHLLLRLKSSIHDGLEHFEQSLSLNAKRVSNNSANAEPAPLGQFDRTSSKIEEFARTLGVRFIREQEDRLDTFTSETIANFGGSLLIVGPAGFGKTSFCRWHALDDLQRMVGNDCGTLPVYVPLHHVKNVGNSFSNAFLKHKGISALLPEGEAGHYKNVRVYLDGLDEVTNPAIRKKSSNLLNMRRGLTPRCK